MTVSVWIILVYTTSGELRMHAEYQSLIKIVDYALSFRCIIAITYVTQKFSLFARKIHVRDPNVPHE